MSRKFNPLSTTVALATAAVVIGVAGCASTRSNDETAGLSRDADTAPTLAQATPTNPLDRTSQPNAVDTTTVAMPAETPTAPIAPVAISDTQPAQPISEATPASPPVTDVSAAAPMPTQTVQPSTPAYPSSTDTTSSTSSTTTTTTDSSNYNNSNADALPPRRDRH